MLRGSLIFLVIAIIDGVPGFTRIAGATMGIAKILFFVFLVIRLAAFLLFAEPFERGGAEDENTARGVRNLS